MFARLAAAALALAAAGDRAPPPPADEPSATMREWSDVCHDDDGWDAPGPPFHIHGQTWYVGTCAIAVILVVGPEGHTLIDSGTAVGADLVVANIRALGFDPADVDTLLVSHEHPDHAGGIARLQQVTGAKLVSSQRAAPILRGGPADPDDPQAGINAPLPAAQVDHVLEMTDGEARILGATEFRALATPGHTPGALSWFWKSCEGDRCIDIAYLDSLTAVSRDDYRFSAHPAYLEAFRASIARVGAKTCGLVLTPHPSASRMRERLIAGALAAAPNCGDYATSRTELLDRRLATEAAGQ